MVLLAFLCGTAIGIGGAYAYFDVWRISMRAAAKKWEDALAAESKELRAWKAAHIGNAQLRNTCCGDATHGCMPELTR